jgi:hypothetical protein
MDNSFQWLVIALHESQTKTAPRIHSRFSQESIEEFAEAVIKTE